MCRILVVYHSQTGHTRQMAEAVAFGASLIHGTKVTLKRAGEADLNDLIACDGVAIGSPEYFGTMAGMIKDFFDRTYEAGRREKKVFKKPYVIFISAGNDGTGALTQIERILKGYPMKKVYDPLLARGEISPEILTQCQELGQTLAAGCEAGIY